MRLAAKTGIELANSDGNQATGECGVKINTDWMTEIGKKDVEIARLKATVAENASESTWREWLFKNLCAEVHLLQRQVAALTSGARTSDEILESVRPARDDAIAGLKAEIAALKHNTREDPRAKFVEQTIAQGWLAAARKVNESEVVQVKRANAQRVLDLTAIHEAEIAKRDELIVSKTQLLENYRVADEHNEREIGGWRALLDQSRRAEAALDCEVCELSKKLAERPIEIETYESIRRSLAEFGIKISGHPKSLCIDAGGFVVAQTQELKKEIETLKTNVFAGLAINERREAEIARLRWAADDMISRVGEAAK
jgi:hypothetical protein